jgi:outer membrane protein OmpA-like peptidoglycan-associated protein
VQAAYGELEIMAIKNNALGDTREMMAKAEKSKFQKIVPKSFGEAQQALKAADDYIGQNPYESATIAKKASHAAFMARRMNLMYATSQKYADMEAEAIALEVEGILIKLTEAMAVGDLRDQEVEKQIAVMADAYQRKLKKIDSLEIARLQHLKKIEDLEERLAGQQGYSREQEAARRKLTAEREFNQRFNKVQAYFQPQEAEVYKQGDQLVIRMRGIRFPVGQAILTPDNYYLLSKVQKAIRTFDYPKVVIEGHTDSTGSAELNQTLSQERAAAVEAYLVANNTLPASHIRSAGFGPDRPLAPNTTAEGRAINRRIDIVIKPSQKP